MDSFLPYSPLHQDRKLGRLHSEVLNGVLKTYSGVIKTYSRLLKIYSDVLKA